jgi:hypothetical protein
MKRFSFVIMSQDSSDTSVLSLHVTQEQRNTIEALFRHNNWNFDVVDTCGSGDNGSESGNDESDLVRPNVCFEQDSDSDRCPHCLCKPCITDERHRQLWWPEQSYTPRRKNSGLRKRLYQKFWTMMYHRGIWAEEEYLQRKAVALGFDPHHNHYVYHKRDIMPACVIKLVRGWYPNPRDIPYMGHMWE